MFNLHSASFSDEIVATSERYTTKQAALKGIKSVRRNAVTENVWIKLDDDDEVKEI